VSVRLFLFELHLPAVVRRRMFRDLVGMTAAAFDARAPVVDRLPKERAVAQFARFTRAEADRAIASGDRAETVRGRLHRGACEMGRAARRLLAVSSPSETMRALRLLYGAIGIEFEGDEATGDITIRQCAFSAHYAPATCRFMSALDAGMAEGVSGGSRLLFTSRMTEGAPCCRATLERPAPKRGSTP